jgi:hypothetical protein
MFKITCSQPPVQKHVAREKEVVGCSHAAKQLGLEISRRNKREPRQQLLEVHRAQVHLVQKNDAVGSDEHPSDDGWVA